MATTVYIVHQGDIDFTPAHQYGELRYITQGYARFDNVKKLSQQIANQLADSKSTDFLILSGNNLLCAIVCLMWMKLHGRINVLHWTKDSYAIVPLAEESYPIIV